MQVLMQLRVLETSKHNIKTRCYTQYLLLLLLVLLVLLLELKCETYTGARDRKGFYSMRIL